MRQQEMLRIVVLSLKWIMTSADFLCCFFYCYLHLRNVEGDYRVKVIERKEKKEKENPSVRLEVTELKSLLKDDLKAFLQIVGKL